MTIPEDLRYTNKHEWARVEGRVVTIGITDYAQKQLGDVVFVELPEEGSEVEQGEPFGVVESVKAASDLYAPLSGRVLEVNDELVENPELINDDPYGAAWMIKIEMTDRGEVSELLSATQYEEHVSEGD